MTSTVLEAFVAVGVNVQLATNATTVERTDSDSSKRPLLAPTAKVVRKRKSAEEKAETKRLCEQRRAQSRISIGPSIHRWRKLQQDMGLKSDADIADFLLNSYDKLCAILKTSTGTCIRKPVALSRLGRVTTESFEEMEVTIEDDECNSVKNRLSDLDSDTENATEKTELSAPGADNSCDGDVCVPVTPQRSDLDSDKENATEKTELSAPGADNSCDGDVCVPVIPQRSGLDSDMENVVDRTELSAPGDDNSCDGDIYVPIIPQSHKTSELKLECEEEELEPWQKHTLQVHIKEEHDVGELGDDQTDCKPDPSSLQSWAAGQHTSEGHQNSNNPVSLSSVQSPEAYATSSNKLQSDQSNSQTFSVLFPPPCLTVIKLEPTET